MSDYFEQTRLAVLWTSQDREVALKMAFMYAKNAKLRGWFDEVKLIIWGPSAKLLVEDTELSDYVKVLIDTGIDVIACKACADTYGASEKLREFGINVFLVGEEFTKILQSDWKVITV